MSKADVEALFGPQYVQDALEFYKTGYYEAELIVVALRKRLRAKDPTLPNVYDGTAWGPIERAWMKSDRTEEA